MSQAIKCRQSLMVEIENYRKDGSEFMNHFMLTPISRDDGKVTHFVGVQNCPEALVEVRRQSGVSFSSQDVSEGDSHDLAGHSGAYVIEMSQGPAPPESDMDL